MDKDRCGLLSARICDKFSAAAGRRSLHGLGPREVLGNLLLPAALARIARKSVPARGAKIFVSLDQKRLRLFLLSPPEL